MHHLRSLNSIPILYNWRHCKDLSFNCEYMERQQLHLLFLPAEFLRDQSEVFSSLLLISQVTVSSAEVYSNSREADYDTFFVACHVCQVISRVLRVASNEQELSVCDFLVAVCFPLMTHKHAPCDYCLN